MSLTSYRAAPPRVTTMSLACPLAVADSSGCGGTGCVRRPGEQKRMRGLIADFAACEPLMTGQAGPGANRPQQNQYNQSQYRASQNGAGCRPKGEPPGRAIAVALAAALPRKPAAARSPRSSVQPHRRATLASMASQIRAAMSAPPKALTWRMPVGEVTLISVR